MAIYDNPTIDLRKRPFFKFAEEEGLDMGALSKDYFYNALETLIQFQVGLAPAFEGQSDRRLPCASKAHSYDRVYEMTGKLLAHSVLHGGIGLIGASPVLAFLLSHPVSKTEVDISGIPMDMNDLPDLELRGLFEKVLPYPVIQRLSAFGDGIFFLIDFTFFLCPATLLSYLLLLFVSVLFSPPFLKNSYHFLLFATFYFALPNVISK